MTDTRPKCAPPDRSPEGYYWLSRHGKPWIAYWSPPPSSRSTGFWSAYVMGQINPYTAAQRGYTLLNPKPILYDTPEVRVALEEEITKLRAALKPFADAVDDLPDPPPADYPIWETPAAMSLNASDLWKAEEVLDGR